MSLKSVFFDGEPVFNGALVSYDLAQGKLQLEWDYSPRDYYAILLYAFDQDGGVIIYWAVCNVQDGEFEKEAPLVDYGSPDREATYTLEIRRQKNFLESTDIPPEESFRFIQDLGPPTSIFSFQVEDQVIDDQWFNQEPSERQKKYCHCVAEVAAKGSAYNPYAICTKSVGRDSNECLLTVDQRELPTMPLNQLQGVAKLHKLPIKNSESEQRRVIEQYIASKNK
jgi:hypothetical protein